MSSGILNQIIILSILIFFGCSFWGCVPLRKELHVPLDADIERQSVYKKFPGQAALLISEEDKNSIYRGTPSSFRHSNIIPVIPLGEALEKDSVAW